MGPSEVEVDLTILAGQIRYVGSPEHKDSKSFAGMPKPRSDASICPRSLACKQDQILGWLQESLRKGHCGGIWENGYPRYIWKIWDGNTYEARLTNSGSGEYKGYPIDSDQCPIYSNISN